MANCCGRCFSDRVLKEKIIQHAFLGRCSYCQEEQTSVLPAEDLGTYFENILTYVKEDQLGKSFIEILDSYFKIFSCNVADNSALLRDILVNYNSDEVLTKKYSVNFSSASVSLWSALKNELKYENRFFPKSSLYRDAFLLPESDRSSDFLFQLIEGLATEYTDQDSLYRARVSSDRLDKSKMGRPPKELASAGRANPVGISYLYLAKNLKTCIAEVRPSNSCKLSIATFKPTENLNLLDLCSPREKASILSFEQEQFNVVLEYISLLEAFSHELSLPVLPDNANLDYISTQFLCEFFKSVGRFDGIIFKSSFGHGQNIVLFTDEKVKVEDTVDLYVINKISHEFDKL